MEPESTSPLLPSASPKTRPSSTRMVCSSMRGSVARFFHRDTRPLPRAPEGFCVRHRFMLVRRRRDVAPCAVLRVAESDGEVFDRAGVRAIADFPERAPCPAPSGSREAARGTGGSGSRNWMPDPESTPRELNGRAGSARLAFAFQLPRIRKKPLRRTRHANRAPFPEALRRRFARDLRRAANVSFRGKSRAAHATGFRFAFFHRIPFALFRWIL